MKVLTVIGTRPEAIKMAPVVLELQRYENEITSRVCSTGQHREMLDQVLCLFDLRPDYDLSTMSPNQTLSKAAATILDAIEPILKFEHPDWVLVQGDTTTVVAASLAAYYAGIRVGHVEAGLRTHNKWQPFPEEVNRRVVGVVADLHFAPTTWAAGNLRAEGVPEDQIVVTGNTVIDAVKIVANMAYDPMGTSLEGISQRSGRLILVTAHRRENFGKGIMDICEGVKRIALEYPDIDIVFPVHLNPQIQLSVRNILSGIGNIHLLPPVSYQSMIWLLRQATLTLTDSGGIQEEAPSFGTPVLVLRDTTERPEGVDAGVVKLIGTAPDSIYSETKRLLDNVNEYNSMARAVNPYGDGESSKRIIRALLES